MNLIVLLTMMSLSASARASTPALDTSIHALSTTERSSLQAKLDELSKESDQALRSPVANDEDLKRQKQTADALRIYDRIPFLPRLTEILPQLIESGRKNRVGLKEFKFLDLKSRAGSGYSHDSSNSVVELLPFRFLASGTEAHVRTWIRSWNDSVVRLVEPEGGIDSPRIQGVGQGVWLVEAHAFRFKDTRGPAISFADPMSLLPQWAQENPQEFAQKEPFLWGLVRKAQNSQPLAASAFTRQEKFRVNEARMRFFFSKASSPESYNN